MLALLILGLAYAGVRGVIVAVSAWNDLPRDNEDMVFY